MAGQPSDSLTVAVVFFLLGVTIARVPSRLHENEASFPDSLPVSDGQSVLRLPSDPDPNARGQDSPGLQSAETMTAGSARVKYLGFHDLRPINRHFPSRSRHPFRRYRHHHLRHGHPFFRPVRRNVDIPHGNGMISSSGEDKWVRDLDLVRRVRLPYRRHHHHHHDDKDGLSKFTLKHGHRFGRERFNKHWHHNDRQGNKVVENEEKRDAEERKEPENGKKTEGGFARRIRKFLGHF